ncbi:DUF1450 domain-containing protein [Paenibacillus wenxiniae]|uniref:DUF1450 domain-containing protein n=1 Tax=Paenibacillus wenxiniae TaxID=1636843 RepID=A0ABW4RDL9_9BACL
METIKYCSKNDKLGTKNVYQDIGVHFPEIKQQRKGCLSECKTCRRQPFAKVGKKMIVGDTPNHLYEQLVSLIHRAEADSSPRPKKDSTGKSRHWFASKNELYITMDETSAPIWIKKLRKLQQSGKPKTLKTIRVHGTSTETMPIVLKSGSEDEDRIKIKKKELTLYLSPDAIEYAIFKLETFLKENHVSPAEYYTFDRIVSKGKQPKVRTQGVQVYFVTEEAASYAEAQ